MSLLIMYMSSKSPHVVHNTSYAKRDAMYVDPTPAMLCQVSFIQNIQLWSLKSLRCAVVDLSGSCCDLRFWLDLQNPGLSSFARL
jgi:hypothetical protein